MNISETAKAREYVAHYCIGRGLDIGCGQEKIVPGAIGIDFGEGYGDGPQTVADYAGSWESYLVDHGGFDYIYSSHLLEDYEDVGAVLKIWSEALVVGGLLVLVLPVEKLYQQLCKGIGVERNQAHRQDWSGWEEFAGSVEGFDVVAGGGPLGEYSFWIVLRRT